MWKWKRSNEAVGLDIGERYLRLLQLNKTRSGIEPIFFKKTSTPIKSWQKGEVLDKEALVRSLKELTEGLDERRVVMGVSSRHLFLRSLDFPSMPPKELEKAVAFEIENQFPSDTYDLIVDYLLLSEKLEEENEKLAVMLFGAPRSLVQSYVDLCQAAELKLIALEPEPLALARLVFYSTKKEEEPVVVINSGESGTSFSVFASNKYSYSRWLDFGGKDITELIARHFGLEYLSALKLKETDARILFGELNLDDSSYLQQLELETTLKKAISSLLRELIVAFDSYELEYSVPRIEKVYLSGGLGLINGVDRFLEKELAREVSLLQPPFEELKDPSLSLVFGLALRELEK